MKAGWKTALLEDLTQQDSPITYGVVKPGDEGDVPFVRGGDIANGRISEHRLRTITTAVSQQYKRTLLRGGELLISLVGQPGQVAVAMPNLAGANIARQVGLIRLQDGVDAEFISYFLRSPIGFDALGKFTGGSVQQVINLADLRRVRVPTPPLPEQKRIVALLDEAFDGIATARAHAEKNLQNARAIFESHLQSVFTQRGDGWTQTTLGKATGGVFTGPFGSLLHKSDYVENGIPLVNPAHITDLGIEPDLRKTVSEATAWKLSSYIMRKGDIVIGRRGEMGRCALVTDVEDGWLCGTGSFYIKPSPRCDSSYLVRFLRSTACRQRLEKIAGGAVMPNLSNTDLSNLRFDLPSIEAQKAISNAIDDIAKETQRLESLYQRKLAALDALKKSLLHQAFSGQLTSAKQTSVSLQAAIQTTTPEFTANIISLAYERHKRKNREKTFGHVKEQKVLHLVESIAGIDLGRHPMRNAAGPNDFPHMLKAEEWAKAHGFFEVSKRDGGYEFKKLSKYDEHLSRARQALAPYLPQLERVIDLLVPMDTKEAEVFATVHAAWNNLLVDGMEVTDDAIMLAARDDWHADKLDIPEHKFRTAIAFIQQQNLAPNGTAKYVGDQHRLI